MMKNSDLIDILSDSLEDVSSEFADLNNNNSHHNLPKNCDCWEYIPMRPISVISLFNKAWNFVSKKKEIKFIEAGCGLGINLTLINKWFEKTVAEKFNSLKDICNLQTDGVEFNRKLIPFAKRKNPYGNIYRGDVRKFDFSSYDMIYFYRPIRDESEHMDWCDYLLKTAKKNAIIISADFAWPDFGKQNNFKILFDGLNVQNGCGPLNTSVIIQKT